MPAAPSAEFLAHYDFHVSLAAPSTEDERFSWDTHVGGDLDVVDYVRGRVNVLADYEAGVFAAGTGEMFGIDRSIAGRSRQSAGRIEAGLRLNGAAGTIELFGGVEQRVDAYPLDRASHHWFLAGFRLISP